MFNFIKTALQKIYQNVTSRLTLLFDRKAIDPETFAELERILLAADTGTETTKFILKQLTEQTARGELADGVALKKQLASLLQTILNQAGEPLYNTPVTILVGINGSGKTTCAGKLAHLYSQQDKRVLLVAADTFRAAATEQLEQWAHTSRVALIKGSENQDPASVVFAGCEQFKKESFDRIIIDTAGRLHTKINLMHELAKIKRVIMKQLPNTTMSTLLVIDSMLGQNSLEQAKIFKESTDVNGIILTKTDSTAKGGIVFAIARTLSIPVAYISFGEKIDQLKQFDKAQYVDNLLTK